MNARDKKLAKQADNEFTGEISDDLNHCLVGTEAIQKYADLIRADERKACAKVCDYMASRCNDIRAAALESAAENIRARGNT